MRRSVAQSACVLSLASALACAGGSHPGPASAEPAPPASHSPPETVPLQPIEVTRDVAPDVQADSAPVVEVPPPPRPRACTTLADCLAVCAKADSPCSSEERKSAAAVLATCKKGCPKLAPQPAKASQPIPTELFGFKADTPYSAAEARCRELGGRWTKEGEANPSQSSFTCADVLGPWQVPVSVEIWGAGQTRRVELVYALDPGDTLADVSLRFAHLFARAYGRPTAVDDKTPDSFLYNWLSTRPGPGYYFRILVRERDDATGTRSARMWIKQEK